MLVQTHESLQDYTPNICPHRQISTNVLHDVRLEPNLRQNMAYHVSSMYYSCLLRISILYHVSNVTLVN